jgi:hypothetical protein
MAVQDISVVACLAESWQDELNNREQADLTQRFQQCLTCTLGVTPDIRDNVFHTPNSV